MNLRVLYFGSYDRGVGRNAILQEGLRDAGVQVAECHVPLWRDTSDKLATVRSRLGPVRAGGRLAATWSRLAARHRACSDYDVMIVGPTAHLDLPLARLLSRRRGAPLVFDPLVSMAETVRDRELLPTDSARLGTLVRAERTLFRRADLVLADTQAHADAIVDEVGMEAQRFAVIPAGAPSVYRRQATPYRPPREGTPLKVVYFGQYIPLHGLETVLRAANLLRADNTIEFELVGVGQTLAATKALAKQLDLPNLRFIEQWLSPELLSEQHISTADICLGAFGMQPKAQCVLPYKVYTAMAAGRMVVTADTAAANELLAAGDDVWTVPSGDPAALAQALHQLADDEALRRRVAAAGQDTYDQRFCPAVLGTRLADLLAARFGAHHND